MRHSNEDLRDIGFTKDRIIWQILCGVVVAVGALLIFIVLPALFGIMMSYIGNLSALNIITQIIYMLLAVTPVEEIVFRGYMFKQLSDTITSRWLVMIISSVLFGLFHIVNGSVLQVIFTTLIGFYFCICREKIKNCTLLSLIIGHALYNTVHPIFTALYFSR